MMHACANNIWGFERFLLTLLSQYEQKDAFPGLFCAARAAVAFTWVLQAACILLHLQLVK